MSHAIRPARPEDIPALQDIERAAAELFRPLGLLTLSDHGAGVQSDADHARAIANGLSLVLECDGARAGFVMGEPRGPDIYLQEIDVHPDFQRRGLGALLLSAFIDAARTRGATTIILSTFRHVPWNAPFYAKHGFTEIPHTDYHPWMRAIEDQQAEILDVTLRLFMRRAL